MPSSTPLQRKIFTYVTIVGVVTAIFLLFNVNRYNEVASGGSPERGYMSFTWGDRAHAHHIMAYWQADAQRSHAVEQMIQYIYAFIFVYASYLIFCLIFFRGVPERRWMRTWMKAGIAGVFACAVLDVFQATTILRCLQGNIAVIDLRYITRIKWALLFVGISPLFILFFYRYGIRLLRFTGRLTASLWLFFPALIFLMLTIFAFWILEPGKDVIVAFRENNTGVLMNYTRPVFFLAIGFWVYVSWYSSRIIAYIKMAKQKQEVQTLANIPVDVAERTYHTLQLFFRPNEGSLDNFPRVIGNGCLLALELAVLQSPLFARPLSSTVAWVVLLLGMLGLYYLNKWIRSTEQFAKPYFGRLFYWLLGLFVISVLVISWTPKLRIGILLMLLLLLHAIYVLYINLRVKLLRERAPENTYFDYPHGMLQRTMNFFFIPVGEKVYYRFFIGVAVSAIALYVAVILKLSFARYVGPFPFVFLAFGVLLAFGNIVTAFSVRSRVSFHFLLFFLAFFVGRLHETHEVRKIALTSGNNRYALRPDLKTYLRAWLLSHNVPSGTGQSYSMFFVMSNGGASRSGYWTARVLGRLQDSSMVENPADKFSDHLFCLSGTSGGGVGVATFFSLLREKSRDTVYDHAAMAFLKQDYFTYALARLCGPDFFSYLWPTWWPMDRAAALESSFENSALATRHTRYEVPFFDSLSQFPAFDHDTVYLPLLFINTTRVQDGNPGVVSNLKIDSFAYNNRVDVLRLLEKDEDISLASGAILGARFPYLSPAGRIADNYFVDGGYFDNSGAGVVQETIRGILNVAKYDTVLADSTMIRQIRNLRFRVIHIVNSPVHIGASNIRPVAAINNDLFSPILTVIGAYDMQTTVNDRRLIHFLEDMNDTRGQTNRAVYTRISLYKDSTEWKTDPLSQRYHDEPPYPMNWFMSDTTRRRIDARLTQLIPRIYPVLRR